MGVNFEQPVMSGGAVKAAATAPAASNLPGQPGFDWNQWFQQQLQTSGQAQQGTDLPITSDPAYMIFQANTGLQRNLSRIGVEQDVPEIQRQMNTKLADMDVQQRQQTERAEGGYENRGIASSGIAAKGLTDIAGGFGRAREDVAAGGQAQIDKLRATDQATQQSDLSKLAGQAFSTVGRTAGGA